MQPKILLIDDSEEISNQLAEVFRAEGYLVDNTSDSEEGAALMKKNRYDVGIFDYKMKGLNGIDLLKRSKDANSQCPVFILSGRPSLRQLIKEKNAINLVEGIFRKPFNIDELLKKVRSSLPA